MSADRPLRRRELVHHGARVALSLTAFAVARRLGCDAAAVIASAAFVFACFGLGHDLMHGVLALPRRLNAALLSFCHLAMLSSGHGVKASHAMHHRAPLSDGDAEGRAARRSFFRAVLWAPVDLWSVRVAGFRLAPRRDRWLVVGESIGCFFVAVGLAAFEAGRIHLGVALALQLSIGVWASHIPHHVPSWLHAIARPIARAPSLVARSLVFHDLHHARPDVPSAWLGRLAVVGVLVAAAPGCASSAAESGGNGAVAQDVASIHEGLVRGDGDLLLRAERRGREREARALVSARELPLARSLRARFGGALVEELHTHVEQSSYRAGVLLEGRYVLRVYLPVAHDADGDHVRASGPAELSIVELADVCVMRDCPDVDADPDDDRLSMHDGPGVRLEPTAVLAPGASLADWLGREPLLGAPVPHGDEAMRASAGLSPWPRR